MRSTALRTGGRGAVVHLGGEPAEAPELPAGTNVLGVGRATLVAFTAALLQGRDAALVRPAPKDHGTCRQIDGVFDPARPSVVFFTTDEDRDVVRALGVEVQQWVRVPHVDGETPPRHPRAPRSLAVAGDGAPRAELLTGRRFVRASGLVVDHYFETLGPAHRYDVAAAFAESLRSAGPWSAVVGVAWGGVYLAAAVALTRGLPLLMVDAHQAVDPVAPGHDDLPVLVVDDLVSTGGSFARCDAALRSVGRPDSERVALFGLDTGAPRVCGPLRVGTVLARPEHPAAPTDPVLVPPERK